MDHDSFKPIEIVWYNMSKRMCKCDPIDLIDSIFIHNGVTELLFVNTPLGFVPAIQFILFCQYYGINDDNELLKSCQDVQPGFGLPEILPTVEV